MIYFFTTKDNKISNLLEIEFKDFNYYNESLYDEIDVLKNGYNKNIFSKYKKYKLYDDNKYKGVCYKLSKKDFDNIENHFEDYKEKFWREYSLVHIIYSCNHLTLKQKNYTYSK